MAENQDQVPQLQQALELVQTELLIERARTQRLQERIDVAIRALTEQNENMAGLLQTTRELREQAEDLTRQLHEGNERYENALLGAAEFIRQQDQVYTDIIRRLEQEIIDLNNQLGNRNNNYNTNNNNSNNNA